MSSKRISEKTKEQIVALYLEGNSIYKISKNLGVGTKTVVRWVENFGFELRKTKYDTSSVRKKKLDSIKVIKLYCEEDKNLTEIANFFEVNLVTVRDCLKNNGVELRTENYIKGEPSPEDKKEIIRLYSKEHRGANYIASILNVSDNYISTWLNNWGVKKISKSDLCKKNREVYGPTKGFTGKNHSKKSKEQISKSGIEAWNKDGRLPVIGKSRTFNTKVGQVLGSYEVAYLQKLINEEIELPKPNRKKIKTPHGYYIPDFDAGDRFIEIKSDFTLKVCKGKMPQKNGNYSDTQWKKIKWVNNNIKSVEIIVLEENKAFDLFVQAINSKFVLDNVEIHKKQYKIIKD